MITRLRLINSNTYFVCSDFRDFRSSESKDLKNLQFMQLNTHTIHPCRCYYKIKYIQNFCVTSPNLIQKLQTTRISRQGLLKAFSYILNFYFLTFQKSVDWSFFKIQYFYICHTNLGKSAKNVHFGLQIYISNYYELYSKL